MYDLLYTAIVETNREGRYFGHIPDLPGVTAAGATVDEMMRELAQFADEYVSDLAKEGAPIPAPTPFADVPKDPDVKEFMRIALPVEKPGKTVKISLSIDEALLTRVDRAARQVGMSRSGFFAIAALEKAGSLGAQSTPISASVTARATDANWLRMAQHIAQSAIDRRPADVDVIAAMARGDTIAAKDALAKEEVRETLAQLRRALDDLKSSASAATDEGRRRQKA